METTETFDLSSLCLWQYHMISMGRTVQT